MPDCMLFAYGDWRAPLCCHYFGRYKKVRTMTSVRIYAPQDLYSPAV